MSFYLRFGTTHPAFGTTPDQHRDEAVRVLRAAIRVLCDHEWTEGWTASIPASDGRPIGWMHIEPEGE